MGRTTTFIGKIRSYSNSRRSQCTPAGTVHSVIFSFEGSIAAVPARVGYSGTTGEFFWLPKGAIVNSWRFLVTTTGTSPTVDIGTSTVGPFFHNELAATSATTITVPNGASHTTLSTTGGLSSNTQVYAGRGASVPDAGVVAILCTYSMYDDGKPDTNS